MRSHRIAVVNQKGGVAKSTTAVNLAAGLAAAGRRVLLLDFDPQSNASHFLGVVSRLDDPTLYNSADLVLGGGYRFDPQRDVLVAGLDLLPATLKLAHTEFALLSKTDGAQTLGKALDRIEESEKYDNIIADCPPTLGMLALNAMIACPSVIVPVSVEPASQPGAIQLVQQFPQIQAMHHQPELRLLGVLATFVRDTGIVSKGVRSSLSRLFGPAVFRTVIHACDSIKRDAGDGVPTIIRNSRSEPALRARGEFELLVDEVLERLSPSLAGAA